jgi:hypothetical protein
MNVAWYHVVTKGAQTQSLGHRDTMDKLMLELRCNTCSAYTQRPIPSLVKKDIQI